MTHMAGRQHVCEHVLIVLCDGKSREKKSFIVHAHAPSKNTYNKYLSHVIVWKKEQWLQRSKIYRASQQLFETQIEFR